MWWKRKSPEAKAPIGDPMRNFVQVPPMHKPIPAPKAKTVEAERREPEYGKPVV